MYSAAVIMRSEWPAAMCAEIYRCENNMHTSIIKFVSYRVMCSVPTITVRGTYSDRFDDGTSDICADVHVYNIYVHASATCVGVYNIRVVRAHACRMTNKREWILVHTR